MPMSPRDPYSGTDKKLVLAFDIGTTYSAISYSILDPGHVPEISHVTGFPGQIHGGDAKIPAIIWYDKDGNARSFGAEACQESVEEQADEEEWVKAQWFKLHMRPQSIRTSDITRELSPLPPGKTVGELFADFMKYLYDCAKAYIQDREFNGTSLWNSLEPTIEYVLTHPNGWEGPQQQQMRRSAVHAGLVPDNPTGHQRIRFVTEGEASLLYCIQNGLTAEPMKNGNGIIIVDAGGGTVDISAYGESSGGKFEEITAADYYLKESQFSGDVKTMVNNFDQSGKLRFEKPTNPVFIRFGGPRDKELAYGIRAGQLSLPGYLIYFPDGFFEESVDCIVGAVTEQQQKATKKISSIFMVGGFSASRYLFNQIKSKIKQVPGLSDVDVCKPDMFLNKPVADGAVSFYLDNYVNIRVSKMAYGVPSIAEYDEFKESHRKRESRAYIDIDGRKKLSEMFRVILPKGEQVEQTQEYREKFFRLQPDTSRLKTVTTDILAYRGPSSNPEWMDVEKDQYTSLCQIRANTSELCDSLTPTQYDGRSLYKMEYEIVMSFGLTELTAQVVWQESGTEKRGPVEIIYD